MSQNRPTYEELLSKLAQTEGLLTRLSEKLEAVVSQRDSALLGSRDLEEAYIESEQNFHNSMDVCPLGVRIVTEDGELIYTNQAILDIYGCGSIEELKALPHRQLYTPESYAAHQERKEKRRRGEPVPDEYEVTIRRPDGGVRILQVFRREVIWGGERQFMAMYQDVTERKKAEEALRESEEKYHSLVEHGNDGIVFIQDGIVLYCNSKMLEMSGYTAEEVSGKAFLSFVAPEHKEMIAEIYRKRVTGEEVRERYELNLMAKDSRKIYTEVSASLFDYKQKLVDMAIIRDITERKRMEQALRESAAFSSSLMENSAIPMMVVNIDTSMRYVNPAFEKLTGLTSEEVIGRIAPYPWWIEDAASGNINELKKHGHSGVRGLEKLFQKKNGERFWVEVTSAPVKHHGKFQYNLENWLDITERKQAGDRLKQALADLELSSAQLQATNKELESFSYSVSHDLRSPLRSIDGFSQALLEDYSARLDEKGQDYLKRLRSASQKMGELIDGLLKLSRLTRSEMHQEKVDLSALAEEISTRLRETQPDHKAKFVINSDLSTQGDPQMLRVLLENLLGNAFKFTAKTPHAHIEFGSTSNGEKKTFFVKDNGAGFDMAYKNKLFGAFQRLHNAAEFPGTGIGLATVQRIINRHGGSIRAEGVVGKGAAFYFTLA